MSITLDILRTYRAPRTILRRRLGDVAREDRALVVLMSACVLIFVAQWPRLSRAAFENPDVPLDAQMAGALFGWVLIAPLLFYALALAVQVLLRVAGRPVTGYQSRMALFWALLAASPLWLLAGLMAGFIGAGTATTLSGALALGAFVIFWGAGLREIAGAGAGLRG